MSTGEEEEEEDGERRQSETKREVFDKHTKLIAFPLSTCSAVLLFPEQLKEKEQRLILTLFPSNKRNKIQGDKRHKHR